MESKISSDAQPARTEVDRSLASFEAIFGCILGTALGDAVGLKREGLSRDRAIWLHGESPSPDLLFQRGFCSDDTEHTVLVGCAMLASGGEVERFRDRFASDLRIWLMTLPAGIGMGTLRAILKSFFVGPKYSGAKSAGNGPAMRSALLGVLAENDTHLRKLTNVSTRATHTDPRAIEGAVVVARAARFAMRNPESDPAKFVDDALGWIIGEDLADHFQAIGKGLRERLTPQEFAEERGWGRGVTGFINQSVPAAVYCWAYSPTDFRQTVTNAVLLGGDTDSVGAIAGAISGTAVGASSLPNDWQSQLAEWPRDIAWMHALSERLASHVRTPVASKPPSLRWGRTVIRNLAFAVTVLVLYFRRYIPIRDKR